MTTTEQVTKARDADQTMEHCIELAWRGLRGALAVTLFQAQYASSAAKTSRKRGANKRYKRYERKGTALGYLSHWCSELEIIHGWKVDQSQPHYRDVLYVDLDTGQASFHSHKRLAGPDYQGEWDNRVPSFLRVCRFCDLVLKEPKADIRAMPFGKLAGSRIEDIQDGYREWCFETLGQFNEFWSAAWPEGDNDASV